LAEKTAALFDVDMAHQHPIAEMHGNPGAPEGRNHGQDLMPNEKLRIASQYEEIERWPHPFCSVASSGVL
jgi:hypothetical protein